MQIKCQCLILFSFDAFPKKLLQSIKNEKVNYPKINQVTRYIDKDLISLDVSLSLREKVSYIYSW